MNRQKQDWEELGELDPLWAVLSHAKKKFGKWDINEFFKTGEVEIKMVMEKANQLGYPKEKLRALDFGCGVGRLTRALLSYFQKCYGVDISENMIIKARELNKNFPNCEFQINAQKDLKIFSDNDFDFIYSSITLQHLPVQSIRQYLSECIRILKKNGLLVFQIPSSIPWKYRLQPHRRLYAFFRMLGVDKKFLYEKLGLYPIRMNFLPEKKVANLLKKLGAKVLASETNLFAGPYIQSKTYFVSRRSDLR